MELVIALVGFILFVFVLSTLYNIHKEVKLTRLVLQSRLILDATTMKPNEVSALARFGAITDSQAQAILKELT